MALGRAKYISRLVRIYISDFSKQNKQFNKTRNRNSLIGYLSNSLIFSQKMSE